MDCPLFINRSASNFIDNTLTRGVPDEPKRVFAPTGNGEFELSVANAGKPVPEAAMEHLFQSFFRSEVRVGLQANIYTTFPRAVSDR
jgi:sigma-B regulation protein RsbU (phosphoserine phosphatase)